VRQVTIRGVPAWKIYPKPERYPVTLVDVAASQSDATPDTVIANICQALRNMDSLRSFTWIAAWSPMGPYIDIPHYYCDVFQTLKESKSLVQFKMVDKMIQAPPGYGPGQVEEYPVRSTQLFPVADANQLSLSYGILQICNH
jgi:hypothetical protein